MGGCVPGALLAPPLFQPPSAHMSTPFPSPKADSRSPKGERPGRRAHLHPRGQPRLPQAQCPVGAPSRGRGRGVAGGGSGQLWPAFPFLLAFAVRFTFLPLKGGEGGTGRRGWVAKRAQPPHPVLPSAEGSEPTASQPTAQRQGTRSWRPGSSVGSAATWPWDAGPVPGPQTLITPHQHCLLGFAQLPRTQC